MTYYVLAIRCTLSPLAYYFDRFKILIELGSIMCNAPQGFDLGGGGSSSQHGATQWDGISTVRF